MYKIKRKRKSREQRLRIVAIWIILSLILSFLVGALAFTPSSAGAAQFAQTPPLSAKSQAVDTDGDGIENNADPDVDGDGIVNGLDDDIDGDGISNFDDADPIDTTDIDSNAPQKPQRPSGTAENIFQNSAWVWISSVMVLASFFAAFFTIKRRKK